MTLGYTADNGLNNSKTFGEGTKITFEVSDEGNAYKNRFVVGDADGVRQIKLAGAAATDIIGVISRSAGIRNGHAGTTASPYITGDAVSVTTAGTELVEISITDSGDPAYLGDDMLVMSDASGKAAKFADLTDLGDTATGAEIMAYIKRQGAIAGRTIGVPDARGLVCVKLVDR